MSAYTDDRTIDESQAAGAWLFLPKPVPLATLIDVFGSLAKQPAAMVIDDEAGLAENLSEALAMAGHEVIVSRTAEEALSHRRRLHTAVVDYRLPDGTGIDVARKLRARDPAIRILFISGHTDELRARLSKELAEADTMEKPLDTGTVVSWIALGSGKIP
jgi:DNA-binding NtrC family response regulator